MHILDWNAFDYGNNFCFSESRWDNLARNPNKICHHHKPKKVIMTTDFKCEKEKWKRCNQNPGKLFVGFEPDNYIGLQDYAKFQLLDLCLMNSACQLPRLFKKINNQWRLQSVGGLAVGTLPYITNAFVHGHAACKAQWAHYLIHM